MRSAHIRLGSGDGHLFPILKATAMQAVRYFAFLVIALASFDGTALVLGQLPQSQPATESQADSPSPPILVGNVFPHMT